MSKQPRFNVRTFLRVMPWVAAVAFVALVTVMVIMADNGAEPLDERPEKTEQPLITGVRAEERIAIVAGSYRASSGKDLSVQADIQCDPTNRRYLRITGFAANSPVMATITGLDTANNQVTGTTGAVANADGEIHDLHLDCTMLPGLAYKFRAANAPYPGTPANTVWVEFTFNAYPLRK